MTLKGAMQVYVEFFLNITSVAVHGWEYGVGTDVCGLNWEAMQDSQTAYKRRNVATTIDASYTVLYEATISQASRQILT